MARFGGWTERSNAHWTYKAKGHTVGNVYKDGPQEYIAYVHSCSGRFVTLHAAKDFVETVVGRPKRTIIATTGGIGINGEIVGRSRGR